MKGTITAKGKLSNLSCELKLHSMGYWHKGKHLPRFGVLFRYGDSEMGFVQPKRGDEVHALELLKFSLWCLAWDCETPDRKDHDELYRHFMEKKALNIRLLEAAQERAGGYER